MLEVSYLNDHEIAEGSVQAGLVGTASNGGGGQFGGSGVVRTSTVQVSSLRTIREGSRELPVLDEVDVLVCGGGPAGTAAAIAAARLGARTLLVERYGYLGGMATAGLVVPHFNPHNNRGLNTEIIAALSESQSWGAEFWRISFDPERWKHVSERLLLDSGSDLLLHSLAVAVVKDGSAVRGVVIENKSGRFAVMAKVVVDATGDGDVAAHAGAAFHKGREEDGRMQAMTSMFRLGGVEWVQRGPQQLWDMVEDAVEATGSDYRLPFDRPWSIHLPNPGEVAVQLTHIRDVDGTDARELTRAEVEGRKQVIAVSEFLKSNVVEFASSYLIDSAAQVGVRETRRIDGEYTLTESDVLAGRYFPDAVASVSFPMDIHESADIGQTVRSVETNRRGAYDIPYRSLLPLDVENLLVAGRCISGTYEAHASYRVKGPCMAMGQAAGTAAAIAAQESKPPRQVSAAELQAALKDQGVKIWPEFTRSLSSSDHDPMIPERVRTVPLYQGPG